MRVIVFASQKGGSGKTTLCGHIAVQAMLTGHGPVAIIDTDPQGSLAQWADERENDQPAHIELDLANLRNGLIEARTAGFKLVCVDTPPLLTREISKGLSFADLVVLPTRPSPHDIRSVGVTVDMVEWHKKPLVFIINGATPKARITSDAAVALSQHGTVAPCFVHNRVDYAASMIDGRTVMEVKPDGSSAKEIAEVWRYLSEKLDRMDEVLNGIPDPHELSRTVTNLNALRRQSQAFGRRQFGS
jgi:chromosome partitioning protein